jgi:hypothetical protein
VKCDSRFTDIHGSYIHAECHIYIRGNHRNDGESVLFSLQNKINFRDFNSSEYKSSKKGKSLKAFLG